jgi:hypothetical protein
MALYDADSECLLAVLQPDAGPAPPPILRQFWSS